MDDGTQFLQYEYDSNGIRQEKSIDSNNISYLVDATHDYAQVIGVIDSLGNTISSYTYGLDRLNQKIGSKTSYYHFDGLGSTRLLSDDSGTITDSYTYKAFGEIENRTGNTSNDYLFTGEQYDANLGFYYLRARYYDIMNSNFINMDTWQGRIYEPTSLHKYAYVLQNPINGTDPSGHQTLSSVSFASTIQSSLATGSTNFFRITINKKVKCILVESIAAQAIDTGLYLLLDGAQLYGGKSKNTNKRIKQHAKNTSKNIRQIVGKFATSAKGLELAALEQFLINALGGKDNKGVSNKIDALGKNSRSKNRRKLRKLVDKMGFCK